MLLSQELEGRKVKIVCTDDEIFEGVVSDYIYPEDNEPEGIACICMEDCQQRPGQWIGFNEDEIKSIDVLE